MAGWWLYLRFKPGHTVKYVGEGHDSSDSSSPSPRPKRYNKGYSKNKKIKDKTE